MFSWHNVPSANGRQYLQVGVFTKTSEVWVSFKKIKRDNVLTLGLPGSDQLNEGMTVPFGESEATVPT